MRTIKPHSLSPVSSTYLTATTTSALSNQKLYELCTHYGKLALHYRRKFIGLLPEVSRRRLYEQKGFNSIYEFAAKLAGVSKEQVQRVLQLEQKFSDKPLLHEALVAGKISVNKLVRIASVATTENQEILIKQTELLSKAAVETLVKDIKFENSKNENGLFEPQNRYDSVPGHNTHERSKCASILQLQNLNLSTEVIEKLCELQNKGIDISQLILEFLEKREQEISLEKAQLSEAQTSATRYIPAKIRKIIHQEHGTKCAIAHCKKPAKTIHHTARFALAKNHNPNFLAPLCREHHQIAHTIDQKFTGYRSP